MSSFRMSEVLGVLVMRSNEVADVLEVSAGIYLARHRGVYILWSLHLYAVYMAMMLTKPFTYLPHYKDTKTASQPAKPLVAPASNPSSRTYHSFPRRRFADRLPPFLPTYCIFASLCGITRAYS